MKLAVVFLSIVLLAGCTANPQDLAKPQNPGGSTGSGGGTAATGQGNGTAQVPQEILFTTEEVSKHNSKYDCWMVIDGKVLDLTEYMAHPGGDTYVPYCGKDATAGFNDKGGLGRNHSSYAFAMIDSYVIGEIGKPMPSEGGNGQAGSGSTTPPANETPGVTTPPPVEPPPKPDTTANQTAPAPTLTMEEVAKHNSANDCWMVIYGDVLNLTYLSSHPGGSTYVPYCGTEATQAFDTKGGRGNTHSSGAVADLSAYTIGVLGQPQNRSIDTGNVTISGGGDDDEWDDDEWEEDD